jgi:hypothetical protein
MIVPCRKVLNTLGYLFTRLCLCVNECRPLNSRGVTGLISQSARTLDCTVLLSSASGATMRGAMTLAGATLGELEINAEGFPLAVGELIEIAVRAKGWVSRTERLLTALPHVRVGPVEADNAECLWVLGGAGTKRVGGGGSRSPVWVVRREEMRAVYGASAVCPMTLSLASCIWAGVLGRGCKQGHGLGINRLMPGGGGVRGEGIDRRQA